MTTNATARPTSPVKAQASKQNNPPSNSQNRVPSSSKFNPSLPPKTPAYPWPNGTTTQMRLPRKDENLLSVNGSPLVNPYDLRLGWYKGIDARMDESDAPENLCGDETGIRTRGNIVIRRDPSAAHSRTDSQLSFYTASSQTGSSSHSRENSHMVQPPPTALAHSNNPINGFRFPSSQHPLDITDATPKPKSHTSFSAMVAIPTKDGHVLEFDPLQTSPATLDALEGISDSAKKQAKVEMGRLIDAAVDKWKIR